MRTAFIVFTTVVMVLLAYGYPFLAVLRGCHFGKTIARAWGLLLGFSFFLCFLLPGIVGLFHHKFGREMQNTWVPEGPGVIAIMFIGWLPPLAAALAGLFVRWLLGIFWWRALAWIETVDLERKTEPEQE